MLGTRVEPGNPRLEIWVEAETRLYEDVRLSVSLHNIARATLSLLPRDGVTRTVWIAPPIPTSLWVPGFIYCLSLPMTHRPGVDHWGGGWKGKNPVERSDGSLVFDLGDIR
jgi:hypothetical protein